MDIPAPRCSPGAEPPKTKARVKKKQVGSDMSKTPPTKGKRLKTSAKEAKTAKKKQPTKTSKAKGLSVLSDVALTEAKQIKLATKRSLIQTHSSHASGSGVDEGTEDDDDEVNVSEDDDDDNDDDIDKYNEDDDADNQDDENLDDANQDDDDEQTESDNDEDDFVHPKISTHNDEARQDDVVNEEVMKTVIKKFKGRDTEITDAPLPNVQGTQVIEDTHVIITAPVNPEGIDAIFTLNNEATSLVDVPVTTIAEPPLLSATTLPPPPTPLITHLQQTPVPAPVNIPSSSLRLKVDTLTPELLTGPTFELMKGSCKSLVELEYLFKEVYKATTEQLDWNNPEECGVKCRESARDVYSKRRIIAVTKLEIVDWHNYKHLDWITIRRDDDKLYKFKEGDFNRLRIQDIEDMLLLLV
ncbi:hypothetical protein Tco_1028563 [Tanacetum coccineum]|uniref:Uncharacterized protein n=1 Tax=Tanacetum coccineum TaxID=301880 RepID=A0ABQ5G344_9ASTR